MSRQFSEDEARAIFARAAERQHATEARGEGLTLEELQQIGREAGLDPAHVAAAVAEAGVAVPPPVVVAGIDLTPRASRVLPARVTDEVWEQMVARLRRTFGSKGVPTDIGRVREWTSGSQSHLTVTVEPVEGGSRVTLETSRTQDVPRQRVLIGMTLGLVALFVGIAALSGDLADPAFWAFIGTILVLGLGGTVAARQSLTRWSERRQGQFDTLLDQFELLARDAEQAGAGVDAVPAPASVETGRLGEIDDLPDPEEHTSDRRRLRG